MTALSAYLDEADDETIEAAATPARGSLEELVLAKIQNMDDVELNVLVEKFISSERMGDRFKESLEKVKAVSEGRCEDMESSSAAMEVDETARSHASGFHGRKWTELARFIPVRLTGSERRILALLDRSLRVSEYTDNVDIYVSRRERQASMESELEKFKSILSGQFIAMKMSRSTESLTEEWFQDVFEVGRRYKAMNPDSMRETYVKLMYMLQDSRSCSDFCEWSQKPIRTVGTILEENEIDKTAFLTDPLLDEFVHGNSKIALSTLVDKFLIPPKSREQIELIAESIKDYCLLVNSFLDPVTQLLSFLNSFFTTNNSTTCSLAIRSGENGSRLTHSHSRQFQYVTQSLRLWREVLLYFMPIWLKAEEDLLASSYRLADTGQGLNRVQGAPNCSRFMHSILDKVQRDLEGSWIGSSVVHMGDHTVPNALMFLDKYCQIPRILGPVAHTLRQLPKEYDKAPHVVREYIDSAFGGVVEAQRMICSDFFKHAFDGSGADNAYDAGSCIDGRLTSSWNWCGKIERKRYFPIFLLTNFVGFDGQHGW